MNVGKDNIDLPNPVPAAAAGQAEQVFICGAPRTGTSVMTAAIKAAFPGYQSYREGHLLDTIPSLVNWVDGAMDNKRNARQRETFMVANVDKDALRARLVKALCDYALTLTGTLNFIEKTPGTAAVRSLPYLSEIFPNGKAIILRRRAIEYLRSARLKFGDRPNLCQQWVATMKAIADVASTIPHYALVIEHRDIVTSPAKTAKKIADHLGLQEDGKTALERVFQTSKIEKTKYADYNPLQVGDIFDKNEDVYLFIEETKNIFEEFGYSYDSRYFSVS